MSSPAPVVIHRSGTLRQDLLDAARAASADPFPDGEPAPTAFSWIYAPGEYESGALRRVVDEGHAVNRFVDYALNFAEPGSTGRFRARADADLGEVILRATGRVTVVIDGAPATEAGADDEVRLTSLSAGTVVDVTVEAATGTPAAVAVPAELSDAIAWEAAGADGRWYPAQVRGGSRLPPHLAGEPQAQIELTSIGSGVFTSDAPVLGFVELRGVRTVPGETPSLVIGESLDEALADPTFAESDTALEPDGTDGLRTRHKLGLRYLRITGAAVDGVSVRASVRPTPRRGAFVASDPELTRIWSTSAYTLRLCLQTFLVDGIKRDRMPWIGDHALGILTNAFAFGDAEIIRDTLTALGRPRHGYINGIADYSLWWVISHGLYQRYFDDVEYLAREASGIHAFLEDLSRHATTGGVFRPADLPDAFAQSGPGGLFLDWGVELHHDRDATAIQMLWYWALVSGATVLGKAGHVGSQRWRAAADELAETLRTRAWNRTEGHWREYLDTDGAPTAYPNFLASLAGLEPPASSDQRVGPASSPSATVSVSNPSATVADIVAHTATGTPFMRAFALRSLGMLDRADDAVAEVRRLWGRMLEAGALTFWEEFGESGASPYAMYRRPFGKSLCHAWSAGPLALLPELVLGLRPRTDGWAEFDVVPRLGELDWAGAVVPTPHGDVTVFADRFETTVEVPAGATAHLAGVAYPGPHVVTVRA